MNLDWHHPSYATERVCVICGGTFQAVCRNVKTCGEECRRLKKNRLVAKSRAKAKRVAR